MFLACFEDEGLVRTLMTEFRFALLVGFRVDLSGGNAAQHAVCVVLLADIFRAVRHVRFGPARPLFG